MGMSSNMSDFIIVKSRWETETSPRRPDAHLELCLPLDFVIVPCLLLHHTTSVGQLTQDLGMGTRLTGGSDTSQSRALQKQSPGPRLTL